MAHPRMYKDGDPTIQRLRELCLALPEAFEKEAWGECTFRVTGGSMFAMTDNNHHGSNRIAVWLKMPRDLQELLVSADAKRFFVPPYVGPKGWLGVRLDYKVDWTELAALLKDAHAMAAPKRLLARMASDAGAGPAAATRTRPARPGGRAKPVPPSRRKRPS